MMFTRARQHVGTAITFILNSIILPLPSRRLRNSVVRLILGKVGRECFVQRGVRFLSPRRVHLADNVVLNFDTLIDGRKHSVTIGRNVSIGPRASILTLGHDPGSPVFADRGGDVVIEDYCWIGYGAVILPGVRLGRGSVVAAGAVVCVDVPDYDIVGGNPARRIGSRVRDLEYKLQYSPWLL